MNKIHNVHNIQTDQDYLYLRIDTQTYRIHWANTSSRLLNATLPQRQHLEVSPSGYGIHWPWIDEDLAITPLLQYAEMFTIKEFSESISVYANSFLDK